jgi:parvulin-like peptidyl-prolyl isomerase
MLIHRTRIALLAVMLICSAGCADQTQKASAVNAFKPPKVLARVNGVPITEADLAFQLRKAHGVASDPENKRRDLEQVIKEELMYQQGLKLGIDKEPGYQLQVAQLESQLANTKRLEMTRRVFTSLVASKVNISDQDVKEYYTKNQDKITTDLHLGMLTFNSRDAAETALKKIKGGASFESVADETGGRTPSGAPGAKKTWDMGYSTWDQIPIDFVDAVYQLKPGQVSDIVTMKQTGFYIFKLFEARKNPKADLNSMSAVIMNRFRDRKISEEYDNYEKQLMKGATIERLN